ncbi:MAG: hypothetical protein AB7O49_05790 [Sphingomonadales bacterium]
MSERLALFVPYWNATDLPVRQLRLLFAARWWIVAARAGRSPRRTVGRALGSGAAAGPFSVFMEQLILAWTEPFIAGHPDCLSVRPDEMLLLALCDAADRGDQAAFHLLLAEMLPQLTRERLYEFARRVTKCLEDAQD